MATSFEKKLDKDFWSYLTLAKDLYDSFSPDEESKNLCEAWLCRLSGKSFLTVDGKRDRNIYLSRLLLQIQNGKLSGIFLEVPPDGPLKSAFSVFGLPAELEELKEIDEKGFRIDPNTVGVSDDLFEVTRDGRTYLATRRIPNGLMAYLAVTVTDGESLWVDQSDSNFSKAPSSVKTCQNEAGKHTGRFVKRLAQFESTPMTQLRKSPQEREKLLEWMDGIIEGCNKWLRDEDPKNKDLETLFELLYQDYQNDPQKAKILEMKRGVRDILMKDIRNRVAKRRDEIAKRELILDQYEADEYKEERLSPRRLDEIWLECAKKPMKSSVQRVLKCIYPQRVIERFFELLIQERIDIIEKREKDAEIEICNLKNDSLNRVNEELLRLQKVQNGYKELFCLYKKVENYAADAQKRAQEKETKYSGESLRKEELQEMKKRIEAETEEKRAIYEDFRAVQNNLTLKIKGLKEDYACMKEKIKRREALYQCEEKRSIKEKEKIKEGMKSEKEKLRELRTLLKIKEGENC